jgi:hypothetical protein
MYSLLLKKAIPFALTFVLGSLIGGLFKFAGVGGQTAAPARAYFHGYGEGRSCRARLRARTLVAETKPLVITFKPDAVWPRGLKVEKGGFVLVGVTFGADGQVQKVDVPQRDINHDIELPSQPIWGAAVKAARLIQFQPETVDGMPVTVTRDVEIRFMDE